MRVSLIGPGFRAWVSLGNGGMVLYLISPPCLLPILGLCGVPIFPHALLIEGSSFFRWV